MIPPEFLTKAARPAGLDLTDKLRRELQLQQIAMSVSMQWGLFPVILLAVSGLWSEVAHMPLSIWCAATTLVSLGTVYNTRHNRHQLLTASDTVPDFTQRNTVLYIMVGTVWGSLPVLAALFGSVEANWFSLVISLASLASLALILSTTQIVFAAAMAPAGVLVLLGLLLGPLPRLELLSISVVYIAVTMLLHRTLFQMQVDRVRTSVNQTAQALALVRMLEHHDPLTGLFNRAGLEDWIDAQVPSLDDNPRALIGMGTIMGFTELNALYGAQVADSLLAGVARRLMDASLGTLGIARLGGAEFIVVDLRPGSDPETLMRMLATLDSKPYDAAGQQLAIGVRHAWVRGSVRDIGALVELARARLQTQYDADDSLASLALAQRRELVSDFHRALVNGEIQAWFQPIIDCRTNALYAWEALVRWQHPRHGQLLPASFLAIARVTRQVPELTRLMLHTSASFVRELQQRGYADAARVHVNITVSELGNPETLDWMERIIHETGVAPGTIVIELTEKDALIVDEQLASNLVRLQRIGMTLAIDDFGTGHANLSRLLDLPAHSIKIDKRFVYKLPQDKQSAALVRSMTTLASGLGMKVIAEGVEAPAPLEFLRSIGCDACQGFYFSRALSADDALEFAGTWAATESA
jgi:diguanylate cyclase (GGDEF)-like protein